MVVLADFEHLNLVQILSSSSLEYLVTIKEQIYLELVHYFYSNQFHNNHIDLESCVRLLTSLWINLPVYYISSVSV